MLDWYMERFPALVLEEQEAAGEEAFWDTDPDQARSRGKLMLGEYHGRVAPRIQPIAAEREVWVDLGLGAPLKGYCDVVREHTVIDVKTGKQAVKKPKEDWRIQATAYGEALGKPVEFHHVSASTKARAVGIVTPLESEALYVNPNRFERDELRR